MIRSAAWRSAAWGWVVACACHAPASTPLMGDAGAGVGVATLQGVTLERLVADRAVLTVHAPRARLSLDGQHAELEEPNGTLRLAADGGPLWVRGALLRASLGPGGVEVTQASVGDGSGRVARSPVVRQQPDGGRLVADPPVVVTGPNFRVVAQGGAWWDPATGALELLGPVEAEVWPVEDGGAPHGTPPVLP